MKCSLLVVCLLVSSCMTAPRAPSNTNPLDCVYVEDGYGAQGETALEIKPVVTGLEVPWSLVFLSSEDWLVAERPGRIRRVRGGKLDQAVVAQIPVTTHAEDGLLGMALHPDFKKNQYLYVYFTYEQNKELFNRVERYKLSADYSKAVSDKIILDRIPAGEKHSGGRIKFGPDGYLYIGTGDAKEPDLAQDQNSLAGKILKVDSEGRAPEHNPWPGNPAYVVGVRNIQAFDWIDPRTIWVVDHGPSNPVWKSGGDEVSIAHAGDNLGWPNTWGCEVKTGVITPQLVWKKASPPAGAVIYRGNKIPGWDGSLLVSTLRSEHMHRVVLHSSNSHRISQHEVYLSGAAGFGRLREITQAPDGELYVTTSNCDGRGDCGAEKDKILRITARVKK
ncbi:MAG: PQQ-dependent sugar dehydrogenase [Proteobacteria bacterium]|nr:MAG: PQQ-dependent sugar dehydrogenase [Pseudomonadota bacterium]